MNSLLSADFFKNNFFQTFLSETLSECQLVLIKQARRSVKSNLCPNLHQQTTKFDLAGKDLILEFYILSPRYEVYRGYIVFAFSVIMFVYLSVCLSVNFFFCQIFLSNYLT